MSRVVFFGSPDGAVISLRRIVDAGHDVTAVYTRPDRLSGRSREPVPTPVKTAAVELDLPVRTPESFRDPAVLQQLRDLEADAFLVVAYGRLLPASVLDLPRLGVLNIHPSLLPRHRGPSPVAAAILEGDHESGVTVMLLDQGMDTGPILSQSEPVAISAEHTQETLTERLFSVGADLLVNVLADHAAGTIQPTMQDDKSATVSRILKRSDGAIDWRWTAEEIERRIRAFYPWPGAFTTLGGKNLKIHAALVAAEPSASASEAGSVSIIDNRIMVVTGKGMLELTRLQLEGRRTSDAAEFIQGHPGLAETVLGT